MCTAERCNTAMVVIGAEVRKKGVWSYTAGQRVEMKTGGFHVGKGCHEDFLKSNNLAFNVLLVLDNL